MATASAGRAFGPLIGALVIEAISYQSLFIVAAGLVLLSVLIFDVVSKRKTTAITKQN
nr:hypothetical protein [Amylolactobacillus amylophilus]